MIVLWVLLGLVSVAVLLHVLLGARGSRQTRAVHDFLLDEGRRRTRQAFSVVVTLDRRAETLMPLLDHLRAQSYPKLQVIIIVKHTAGSKAQATLAYYKRKHGMKSWSIVRHRRGMTPTSVAQRYATGQYVLTLQPGSRVDDGFFDRLSRAAVSTGASVLLIRSLRRPVRTFAATAHSLEGLLETTFQQLFGKPKLVESLTPGVAVSRSHLRGDTTVTTRPFLLDQLYIDDTAVVMPKPGFGVKTMVTLSVAAVIIAGLLTWAFLTLTASDVWLLAGLSVALCIGVITSLQMSNKGYRAIDMLNTALFLPIAPVYGLLRFVALLTGRAIAAQRQRQASRP
jgi:hypothetical protein